MGHPIVLLRDRMQSQRAKLKAAFVVTGLVVDQFLLPQSLFVEAPRNPLHSYRTEAGNPAVHLQVITIIT